MAAEDESDILKTPAPEQEKMTLYRGEDWANLSGIFFDWSDLLKL